MIISKNQDKKKKSRKSLKIRKRQRDLEVKSFFSNIICEFGYIYLKEIDEHLENLFLLTDNRNISDIFLISSNQFRIITAIEHSFCAIPVTKFQCFMQSDFQLNLVDNYLVKLKFSKDMKAKNQIDFGYLTQNSAINKQYLSNQVMNNRNRD